ncbi:MAG: BamA/TamA family outer membrane protein [bacterium]|nr:BamA/TamA family outer membrane protein [bacterium]
MELTGPPRTRPDVVQRYLLLAEGEPLHAEDLLAARQRLSDTGFFRSVDVYARPGSEKGLVVVVVDVQEHRWPQYRFKGGHGELDGWYVAPVGFVFDNFSGHGHRLDWESYVGSHVDGETLHYQHPHLFADTAVLDVDLFSQDQSLPHYIRGAAVHETVATGGIRLRYTAKRGRFRSLYGQLRTQTYRPEANVELDPLLHGDLQRKRVTALGLGLQADTRDHVGHPTHGFWGRAVLEQAIGAGFGDLWFTKLTADGRWYAPLKGRNVVAVRVHGGLVTAGAPFYERYYLGGPYSLRGFDWAELSPAGWGTRLLSMQSELRFPFGAEDLAGPRHTGVIYYDAGGIWLPGEVPVPMDLHHSIGLGYRRRMRVLGMLRFDLSLPVRGITADVFQLNVNLGHAF